MVPFRKKVMNHPNMPRQNLDKKKRALRLFCTKSFLMMGVLLFVFSWFGLMGENETQKDQSSQGAGVGVKGSHNEGDFSFCILEIGGLGQTLNCGPRSADLGPFFDVYNSSSYLHPLSGARNANCHAV